MSFLLDKLFFRDIITDDSGNGRDLRRTRWVALAVILAVFLAGTILTAGYAYTYYNSLKEQFFSEPESIQELKEFDPAAVWFTQELGDPYRIQGIIAYLERYVDNQLTLNIANVNDIPVELISVQDMDNEYAYPFKPDTIIDPSDDYQQHTFTFNNVNEAMMDVRSELIINYRYDDGVMRQAMVTAFKKVDEEVFDGTTIRTVDNTSAFDFIKQDSGSIYFEGDRITIDEPLYIPEGKPLYVRAGQEIDLVNQAFIVSRAAVKIEGSETQPVRFITSDKSGRGLLVLQAQDKSLVKYAQFDGLDTQQSGIWELTGAITFYESDVDISNSAFINNPSEDGLNIIRSRFTISDSYFAYTASDAFDADFCEGIISGSTFENTANDAIDVSGSLIEVRDVLTRNNGDKGISVGENSTMVLESVKIDHAIVGIASKDFSNLTGRDVQITNSRIALTLYIKKPEYGPAKISLEDLTMGGDIDIDYLIQPGSTLKIDGRVVQPRAAAKETLVFEKMINGEPIQ